MSDTPKPKPKPIQKERFITLESDFYIARDCATGINYHLGNAREAAGLAATFNLLYAHAAELEVKCNTAELANAELRNKLSNLEQYSNELDNYYPDNEIAKLDGEEETHG